jgi:hypothetical protein
MVMDRTSRLIALASSALAMAAAPSERALAGGCGSTVTEQLTGATLNGVVPDGRAFADESQLLCGGSTTLTVEVANVNLPDGTVLDVTLDFRPIGTISISGARGALTADLGRFGVSNDEVRVSDAGTLILVGSAFR